MNGAQMPPAMKVHCPLWSTVLMLKMYRRQVRWLSLGWAKRGDEDILGMKINDVGSRDDK